MMMMIMMMVIQHEGGNSDFKNKDLISYIDMLISAKLLIFILEELFLSKD